MDGHERVGGAEAPRVGRASRLTPIVQDSTPTIIARQLREAIASGDFAPGQQMLESALATSLGVSRGPLREAMQRLTQEGLLVSRRNRGLFVMDLDDDVVRDVYLARAAVERAALAHVVDTGRTASAAELLDVVERMSAHDDPADPALVELDLHFHELLVELSGSPLLRRMHETLLTQMRMCLFAMAGTYSGVELRVREHRAIAEAVLAGDAAAADRLLVEHMRDGQARILGGAPAE